MNELFEFHKELTADVQGDADVYGLITAEAFFEYTAELLSDAGEIEEANRSYYKDKFTTQTLWVDGYGGDPAENSNILSLILCDFDVSDSVRTINKSHIERLQNQLYQFLLASLNKSFRDGLEETSAGYGLADLISTRWPKIEAIKLIISTNANYSARSDAEPLSNIDGRAITLSVWDLKRLKQFKEQGQARADLLIDFENDFGGSIPLIEASGVDGALESYLAVIPGKQLAEIYNKWGPRLLEANVRSFLQARGKVNQGIRNTIRDEPEMFFSYNNGLSVTADNIDLIQTTSGLYMSRADNLQIVNGGQTTASLHSAQKTFPEQLEKVHVQMKLTIVPPKHSEKIVPRISEYANSQNKVNAADFFSNHPFHIKVEEFSRKVLAPAGTHGYRESKWFYERARGQYADQRGNRTPAERKKFDTEYPRAQFFQKTDLAKYENTFDCIPHIVSLGAQKNFTRFASNIGKAWGQDGSTYTELWFKRLIAKAIVFKGMERLVSNAEWYVGGYRANIVTYGISKVVFDLKQKNLALDLDSIWKKQSLNLEMSIILLNAGEWAQEVITNPPSGIRNSGEWAKKEICWNWLSEKKITYHKELSEISISKEVASKRLKEDRINTTITDSYKAEIEVYNLGGQYWSRALNWAYERSVLSPRDISILEVCAAIPNKLPSEKQSNAAWKILTKLKELGFQ